MFLCLMTFLSSCKSFLVDNLLFLCFKISDAEETMGVIRTEPIQVIAEAYDVAVDIAFPKGRVLVLINPNTP